MLHNELKTYLESLEEKATPLKSLSGEHKIGEEIRRILKKDKGYEPTKEDIYECMVFDFMPNYPNNAGSWGTYYGPIFGYTNEKGHLLGLEQVNQGAFDYWAKRAKECKNPILSSRYADLVVDFSPKIIGTQASVGLVQIVIDSNVAICQKRLTEPLDRKTKIKRALDLVIKFNDKKRVPEVKDSIIGLEEEIVSDKKGETESFALKWLSFDYPKRKTSLSDDEEQTLVVAMEESLKRVKDLWFTESVILLLAKYYARQRDESKLVRILNVLESSIKVANMNAIFKVEAYDRIRKTYERYVADDFLSLKGASERILHEIQETSQGLEKSMGEISFKMSIDQKDIDKYISTVFGENGQNELEVILAQIVGEHVPKKDDVRRRLERSLKETPLLSLIPKTTISSEGQQIAKIPGIQDDKDGSEKQLRYQMNQDIQIGTPFLSMILKELKQRISASTMVKHLELSVVFESGNKDDLERAVSAYWENDHGTFSRFAAPIIENGLRGLVKACGGIYTKPNNEGGFDYPSLSALLDRNEDTLERELSKGWRDMSFYFRSVLTDRLGMNLRNELAHGIETEKFSEASASDRLFHVLICLFTVKRLNKPD